MRKWIAVTIVLVVIAGAGAAAAGIKLITDPSTPDLGPCRTAPASDTQPTYVVALGTNASDAQLVTEHTRHLAEVVLPLAGSQHARVVVGTIAADSEREPTLVGDVSLRPTGEASDNPENQADWVRQKTAEILRCAQTAADATPADRSDVFGALAWAANVLPPQASRRHVVVLSDAINTTEGCNLTGRDISAVGRHLVAEDCGDADYSGLAGAEVWLAGVGLNAAGDAPDTLTPTSLTEFWTWFVETAGARVTRAGATLLPGE